MSDLPPNRTVYVDEDARVLTDGGALAVMQEEGRRINVEKGWYESDRTFGDDIALLHSEVSEAFEAYRQWGLADASRTVPANGKAPYGVKPEGVGSELADVLVRLLDTCERRGIDLFAEWRRKVEYNRTRPYQHGGRAL